METLRAVESTPPRPSVESPRLRLHLVYTTPAATRMALRVAGQMANNLDAALELLVPHVVPFPLPLDHPSIPTSFTEGALSSLVADCGAAIDVKVLLCRDREETLPQWIPAHAIVVIGRQRKWGPGCFSGLIRAVRQNHHQVIVVDGGTKD
ncbi:MAG: hypothetical protein ABI806_07425 [Candidatus Solibacter sp.]